MELEVFDPRVDLFPLPVISPIIPNVSPSVFSMVSMQTSTIIKVDLNGFHKTSLSQSAQETTEYLSQYYSAIESLVSPYSWRIVKCIGDCVLLKAENNTSFLSKFFLDIKSKYNVSVMCRVCEFEELNISLHGYSCKDVVGSDINKLFLADASTTTLD